MDIHERLARNLRKLRLENGWSQEELAGESGIHRTYISDLERGQRNPSISKIDQLARCLCVEVGALLD